MTLMLRIVAIASALFALTLGTGCRPVAGTGDGGTGTGHDGGTGTLGGFGDPCVTTANCGSGLGCVDGVCLSDITHDASVSGSRDSGGGNGRDGSGGRPDTDAGPPPGMQGLGDACNEDTMRCRFGLRCVRDVCEGSNDAPEGGGCELSDTCADGLYCAEGVCTTAGTGEAGDTCTGDADCETGLRCESGICLVTGTGDVGDTCTINTHCAAGLSCVRGTCQATSPITATGCEGDVMRARQRCEMAMPGSPSLCFFDAMLPLCATGRPAFIRQALACFSTDPLAGACATPVNPGNEETARCIDAAIWAHLSDADWWLGSRSCGCDDDCDLDHDAGSCEAGCEYDLPRSTLGLAMMMSVSDVAELNSCSWWSCSDSTECIEESPLAAVLDCR